MNQGINSLDVAGRCCRPFREVFDAQAKERYTKNPAYLHLGLVDGFFGDPISSMRRFCIFTYMNGWCLMVKYGTCR